jgi:hypothetical protein
MVTKLDVYGGFAGDQGWRQGKLIVNEPPRHTNPIGFAEAASVVPGTSEMSVDIDVSPLVR